MKEKTKIVVYGAAGRMGGNVVREVIKGGKFELSGAVEASDHSKIGEDMGSLLGIGEAGLMLAGSLSEVKTHPDVLVDFTNPKAAIRALDWCVENKTRFITGTTGFDEEELTGIEDAGNKIAVLRSSNMSIGVNVLFELSGKLAKMLPEADIEILEKHHRNKVDSPSGTALQLGKIIAESRGDEFQKVAVFGRHGKAEKRDSKEIGIHSIRAGEIIGDHSIMFSLPYENLVVSHQALSRNAFTYGVMKAIEFIMSRTVGYYTMSNIFDD
ncbi:4-hydroxy-tetrahydrodipicolinate reductase [bacterium]|nr:4-hydroxy-tetrahydrodipicolinate reductase [bacterium]